MNHVSSKNKKVLVIKLGAIGDSILATIILYAIKQAHPDWQVDYLTHESFIPLLKDCSYIDNLIAWKSGVKNKNIQILKMAKRLQNEHYDIIFNLTRTLRSFILTSLAFPKKTVMKKEFNKSWCENFYLTAKTEINDLIKPERLYISANKQTLQTINNDICQYHRPYVVIIPGGSSDYTRQGRIWNINKWKELTKLLVEEYGGTILVLGNKDEIEYHSQLAGKNVMLLTGKYLLPESSALLSMADLVISGDTGPIHIASAHNVKTLAILGSTSPDKIKPYGENGYYIEPAAKCRYCWKKKCKYLKPGEKYTPCMESITPDDVIGKIKSENLINKVTYCGE